MFTLLVVDSAGARSIPVPPPPARLVLGGDRTCDVVLRDADAEPRHAVFEVTPAGLRVSDHGSRSGTRLNGFPVAQALVRSGDQVALGRAKVTIMEEAGAYPAAPAAPPAPAAWTAPPPPPPPPSGYPAPPAPAVPPRPVGPALVAGRTAPRPRGHGRLYAVLAFVAAAGIVGGLLLLTSGRSERQVAAAETFARAKAAWEGGRVDEAESLFESVARDYPDLVEATRAQKAVEEIRGERDRVARAERARAELRAQWNQMSPEEFEIAWRDFRSSFPGTPAADDPKFLDEVKAEYRGEGERRFEETRRQAARLVNEGRFQEAILVWHEYIYLPQIVKPDIPLATGEFERIQVKAREVYEAVSKEAEALIAQKRFDEAAALLRDRLDAFRGTRHSFDLRQKLEVLAVLREDSTAAPEVVEAKVEQRREYLRAAEDAETLVTRRRYADAVAAYLRAAEDCPDPALAEEFRGRARDLEGRATLFAALLAQVREHPERFRNLDLGHGLKANATAATEDELVVSLRGAESRLPWARMGPERVLAVLSRLSLDGKGLLHLAAFAFRAGDEDAGHEAVSAALRAAPELEPEAFGVLARARKMPVPEGGFVFHRKRWMTPAEKQEAELEEEVAAAEKDATSSDPRRREAGLARLKELGNVSRTALVRALTRILDESVESLVNHPFVRDPALKAVMWKELLDRRKAALALIFDEAKYPYPHPEGPEYAAVQAEVDGLVDKVRALWERPISYLIDRVPEVGELYSRAETCALELSHMGSPPAEPFESKVAAVNRAIDLMHFPGDSTAKNHLEWNEQVLRFNREVKTEADEQERACVDATNEYRMMMGVRAVMWNAKLLACARAHSTHMREHGYFAHDVPLPGAEFDNIRTPNHRARLAGYTGGVSENIARGSQEGRPTFLQWYGSSGHHRNMLGKDHTEIGVGRSQDFWTQNFGRASQKVEAPKPDPAGAR